jgi:hypothetical protein
MSPGILKEVRLLFWPWCLMTFAGLVPLIKLFLADKKSDWPEGIAVLGFFGGAAVLTALCFCHALRICPPTPHSGEAISRHKIWSEKMAVLMVGIVCAGFIACLVQTVFGIIVWSELSVNAIEPVLLLVIIVCSTGFWTLVARSVVGGILLAGVAQFALYLLLVLFAAAINRMSPASPEVPRLSHDPEIHAALGWFVAGFGLSYAAIMLWLGRRRFATMELRNDAA